MRSRLDAGPSAPNEPVVVDEEAVRAALAEARGSVTRAAAALGLPSRYVLYRLLRRYGINPGSRD